MAGNLPMLLKKKEQEAVLAFSRQCTTLTNNQYNLREQMQQIDLIYQREVDWTKNQQRAKLANRYGDPDKFQNIVVPVVMPAVESAVTYQASVFLTGTPIFGVTASPQYINEALQMETVIDDQSTKGAWVGELMMFFRDGFKYNLCAVELSWERKTTAALETNLKFHKTHAEPKQVVWEGNKLKRMDMYNTFWDTRVAPSKVHTHGEFAGYNEMMSRVALKQFISELPPGSATNVKEAFESGLGGGSSGDDAFYIPKINPFALLEQDARGSNFNWMAWAGMASGRQNTIQYKDSYEVKTLYGRIIPDDFGMEVPARNTPQIWKFIIVNNSTIIYAERQTNAHGYLPILFSQPLEDGLSYQTKSLADNVAPIQSITTALANSQIAARRRAVSDRALYDPSRIDAKHINNENPSAKIPVRPAAYGKNISEAVYQFPFRDDQASIITQEIQQYRAMGNDITGQNPVRQGQFVKGNKTKKEFSDVMANANGRDQMTAIVFETRTFTPLKEMIKINILQYQGGVSLYNRSQGEQVDIDPVGLRKAVMEFKISDGLTPADKLISADITTVAFQTIATSPALQAEYNIGPMFSYLMKSQGAQIASFEKSAQQKSYEQAVSQWQQAATNVMELLKHISMKIEGMTLEKVQDIVQQMLPIQPKPADFGYNPQQQVSPDSGTGTAQSQSGDNGGTTTN